MAHTPEGSQAHPQVAYGHVASMPALVGTFVSLLALTALTVAAAYVDMGNFNLLVAMGIATVKAFVVAMLFMHLAHDTGFNRMAFFGSFVFIALFVGITMMDSNHYQENIIWQETVTGEKAGGEKK